MIEFHADILEGDFQGLPVLVTAILQPDATNSYQDVQFDSGTIVQVSGTLTAQGPNYEDAGLTAYFEMQANALKIVKRHSNALVKTDDQRLLEDLFHLPVYKTIKHVDVFLRSACIRTLYENTGTNHVTDPCYKVEFQATIINGDFKGLPVLVVRHFKPAVVNPFKNVQLGFGMVVQISGKLTPQHLNNDETGLTAFFQVDATLLERNIRYSNARKKNDDRRLVINPLYTQNIYRYGEFIC